MIDSCSDQWRHMPEPISSAPVAHTPGLYEMPVTRSLLSIGWPALRPAILLAASGEVAPCSVKQWKERTSSLYLVVVAVFLHCPSLLRVYCAREKRQHPHPPPSTRPPLCVPLNHPLPTISMAAPCLPLSYYCFWKKVLLLFSFFIFSSNPFSYFCH